MKDNSTQTRYKLNPQYLTKLPKTQLQMFELFIIRKKKKKKKEHKLRGSENTNWVGGQTIISKVQNRMLYCYTESKYSCVVGEKMFSFHHQHSYIAGFEKGELNFGYSAKL